MKNFSDFGTLYLKIGGVSGSLMTGNSKSQTSLYLFVLHRGLSVEFCGIRSWNKNDNNYYQEKCVPK